MKTLFSDTTLVTMTPRGVLKNAYLGTEDEKITYVGTERPEGFEDAEQFDGRGRVLMPGLINMHTQDRKSVV